jgi:hypothetical protein
MMRFPVSLLAILTAAIAVCPALADAPDAGPAPQPAAADPGDIRFEWSPPRAPALPYDLPDPRDQHRIVLMPGVEKGGSYPVLVGFHGQPARGKLPRDYGFAPVVEKTVREMVESKQAPPLVLVMPVFRWDGQNWPAFDPRAFKVKVEALLAERGIKGSQWYAFGHSGAAGCGGRGLNEAHLLQPRAVGFFDTCLGKAWGAEVKELYRRGMHAVSVHSVETAGFEPRQKPEYQAGFDFAQAYAQRDIRLNGGCPKPHPGDRLRKQKFNCAGTRDGLARAFVVDTGEGEAAHTALLPVALRYFILEYVAKDPSRSR